MPVRYSWTKLRYRLVHNSIDDIANFKAANLVPSLSVTVGLHEGFWDAFFLIKLRIEFSCDVALIIKTPFQKRPLSWILRSEILDGALRRTALSNCRDERAVKGLDVREIPKSMQNLVHGN
jgi:hypothetical protein